MTTTTAREASQKIIDSSRVLSTVQRFNRLACENVPGVFTASLYASLGQTLVFEGLLSIAVSIFPKNIPLLVAQRSQVRFGFVFTDALDIWRATRNYEEVVDRMIDAFDRRALERIIKEVELLHSK